MRIGSLFVLSMTVVCLIVGAARAGEVMTAAAHGPGLGSDSGDLTLLHGKYELLNNDNAPNPWPWGSGDNWRSIRDQLYFRAPGLIDVVFSVDPSGGTTEHELGITVYNGSGRVWHGMKLVLGTNIGDTFTPLTTSPLDGLDFDSPDWDRMPKGNLFGQVVTNATGLTFGDGTVGLLASESIRFFLDVPDHPEGGGYEFTLRHQPLVPEPASLSLLVVGALMMQRRQRG